MTQYVLHLPPSSGDLPWDEQGNTEILADWGIAVTTCAYCNRRMPLREAFVNPTDQEHYCNKSCRDMAHYGDGA